MTSIDCDARTGQARDYDDGHIRAWTARDEADMFCPAGHRSDSGTPCAGCTDQAVQMLAVAAEMYEGGFDPDDVRHVGFSDGWWAASRYATQRVLAEVADERARQDAKWGEQNHIDGTGPRVPYAGRPCYMADAAEDARRRCQANGQPGRPDTWRDILLEEVFEALAEADPAKLRMELIQVAAVAAQWVECIDRRRESGEDR